MDRNVNEPDSRESDYIRDLKNDSVQAFNCIYRIYAKRLYAFCLQYTKLREDAEEVVSDTFVWLWNNRHSIRQEETLKSLLFIRTRHFLINAYRSMVSSPVYEDYVEYKDRLQSDSDECLLEYEDFLKQIKRMMRTLPMTQRRVIELSKIEQLSNQEIALKLNLSEQTVKNQLSLGLKRMRELLKMAPVLYYLFFS